MASGFSAIFLFFTFCFGHPAKVINANMQDWAGGIGSTKGTNYTVTVVAKKSSDKMIPVYMGFKNKGLKFIILKNNKKLGNQIKYNKGDTLIFKCSYTENLKQKNVEKQQIDKQKIYITFLCTKNTKRKKNIEITKFNKLKPLMYP